MLAQPGGSLKQALNVFKLVMRILAKLLGATGDVLATQLLGDDGELVDRVAADVGAVDLPQEVAEDQRITSRVNQLSAGRCHGGVCRDELAIGIQRPVQALDSGVVGGEQVLLGAADLALTPVGLFRQLPLCETGFGAQLAQRVTEGLHRPAHLLNMRMSCAHPAFHGAPASLARTMSPAGSHPPLGSRKEHTVGLHIVVHPRFGDTARVATDTNGRPQLMADIDTRGTFSIQVDDELGSIELAAQFARELADAALRFAQRCEELLPAPVVGASVASGDGGANNGA